LSQEAAKRPTTGKRHNRNKRKPKEDKRQERKEEKTNKTKTKTKPHEETLTSKREAHI